MCINLNLLILDVIMQFCTFSFCKIPPFDVGKAATGHIFPIAALEYGIHSAAEIGSEAFNVVFVGDSGLVDTDEACRQNLL